MRNSQRGVRILRYLKLLIWAFPVGLLIIAWPLAKDLRMKNALGPAIEAEFGFKASTVFVFENRLKGERVVIESVTTGGRFERAGFQEGDVLVTELKIGQLYQLIDSSRGGAVEFRLVRGGNGPSLSEREVRKVRLLVSPAAKP